MDRYELNDTVVILEPFGDNETVYSITGIMPINVHGEEALEMQTVDYYQYEVNGAYYAEQYLRKIQR